MIKLACWNIYFSHELLIAGKRGIRVRREQEERLENVLQIIRAIDADVLGIVECMPREMLRYLVKNHLRDYECVVEGDSYRLNIGIVYKPDVVGVRKVAIAGESWKDRLGDDRRRRTYKWTRLPLLVEVEALATEGTFLVAVVHPKSKKTYSSGAKGEAEAYENRKRIVAEGRRLHALMWEKPRRRPGHERFVVMGDINDGPRFDEYEARIFRSGLEAHIGSVFGPNEVLHSFVDLSDERGVSTTPPSWGAPQLDHMLYSRALAHGDGGITAVADSGRVRSDLVDFSSDSGKKRDSDHVPVEMVIDA